MARWVGQAAVGQTVRQEQGLHQGGGCRTPAAPVHHRSLERGGRERRTGAEGEHGAAPGSILPQVGDPGEQLYPVDAAGFPSLLRTHVDPIPVPAHVGDAGAGGENDQLLEIPGPGALVGRAPLGDHFIEPELHAAVESRQPGHRIGPRAQKLRGRPVGGAAGRRLDAGAGEDAEGREDG